MGQNLVEQFITPEHRARVQGVIDQALAGEETANFGEYDSRQVYHLNHLSTKQLHLARRYHIPISPPHSLLLFYYPQC